MTEPLPYATPSPNLGRPILAGVAIGILGLGLAVIGGCFLIGILIMHSDSNQVISPFASNQQITLMNNYWTFGRIFFATVLYLCAFVSFGGAMTLLFLSVRKLLKST